MGAVSVTIEEQAARWAAGVKAAEPYTNARRVAAREVAKANRATAARCAVKGCSRSGRGRGICERHWGLIPQERKVRSYMAVLTAQMGEARKQHRLMARELNSAVER